MIEAILTLAKKRIAVLEAGLKPDFYKGSETFIESIGNELDEALAEMRDNNTVRLEDELGDVFWVYVNLLESLAAEGKITSSQKVWERCYKKFSERINPTTGINAGDWSEIKAKQKEQIAIEHNNKYSK